MAPDPEPSRHEKLTIFKVEFVGEQDGPPERELKLRLVMLFENEPSVRRAYLARVRYENASTTDVAFT